MTAAPLHARELSVAYGDAIVLDGLDLAVPRAQITAIVGANGCGKSTLLRALARLVPPRAGPWCSTGARSTTSPRATSRGGSACSRSRRSRPRD